MTWCRWIDPRIPRLVGGLLLAKARRRVRRHEPGTWLRIQGEDNDGGAEAEAFCLCCAICLAARMLAGLIEPGGGYQVCAPLTMHDPQPLPRRRSTELQRAVPPRPPQRAVDRALEIAALQRAPTWSARTVAINGVGAAPATVAPAPVQPALPHPPPSASNVAEAV